MTASYRGAVANLCDNESGPGGAINTSRSLTPQLDLGERGLAMKATPKACSVPGCDRAYSGRGWCNLHYQRWLSHGDPLWMPPTPADRFWRRVDKDGPVPPGRPELGRCWLWVGGLHASGRSGYGWTGSSLAHRRSYELATGPIADGLQIDHLCRNRICVNPTHLEAVTQAENIYRSEAPSALVARTGHCQRGHHVAGPNLYIAPGDGSHRCLACVKERRAAS